MKNHLKQTKNHTFLFQTIKNKTPTPLSSQRISSIVRPVFTFLKLPYSARHLRQLGSSYSLYSGSESIDTIVAQARWKDPKIFFAHYLKAKHK